MLKKYAALLGNSEQVRKESKKDFIENTLAVTLNRATEGQVVALHYSRQVINGEPIGDEKVQIVYANGYTKIANVSCDSKWACIADICRVIDW